MHVSLALNTSSRTCERELGRSLVKRKQQKDNRNSPSKVGSLDEEGNRELGVAEDSIPHDGGVSLFAWRQGVSDSTCCTWSHGRHGEGS